MAAILSKWSIDDNDYDNSNIDANCNKTTKQIYFWKRKTNNKKEIQQERSKKKEQEEQVFFFGLF